MKKLVLIAALALTGCATSIDVAYVSADRQTKKSLEPVLDLTKKDHPALAPAIDDTLSSWETRLQSKEQSLATTQP